MPLASFRMVIARSQSPFLLGIYAEFSATRRVMHNPSQPNHCLCWQGSETRNTRIGANDKIAPAGGGNALRRVRLLLPRVSRELEFLW